MEYAGQGAAHGAAAACPASGGACSGAWAAARPGARAGRAQLRRQPQDGCGAARAHHAPRPAHSLNLTRVLCLASVANALLAAQWQRQPRCGRSRRTHRATVCWLAGPGFRVWAPSEYVVPSCTGCVCTDVEDHRRTSGLLVSRLISLESARSHGLARINLLLTVVCRALFAPFKSTGLDRPVCGQ